MSWLLWMWAQYPLVMILFVVALLVTAVGFFKSFGPDLRRVETRSCVHVVEADTETLPSREPRMRLTAHREVEREW